MTLPGNPSCLCPTNVDPGAAAAIHRSLRAEAPEEGGWRLLGERDPNPRGWEAKGRKQAGGGELWSCGFL